MQHAGVVRDSPSKGPSRIFEEDIHRHAVITDDVDGHPLKSLANKLEQEDNEKLEKVQNEQMDDTPEDSDKCQQEISSDFLQKMNLYYLKLVKFKILEANGDLKDLENKHRYLYSKTALVEAKKNKKI